MIVGNYYLVMTIVCLIRKGLCRLCKKNNCTYLYGNRINKRRYYKIFGFLLIVYLSVCIIRYPGIPGYDDKILIESFLDGKIPSNSWHATITVINGAIVWIGKELFGKVNHGYFLLKVFQSMVVAAALSYSIKVMEQYTGVSRYSQFVTLVYAFTPTYFLWTTGICKDCLYAAAVIWFISLIAGYLLDGRKNYYIYIIIAGFLMSQVRRNGIIIIYGFALCMIISLFIRKKKALRLFILTLIIICLDVVYNNCLLPAAGINPGGEVREGLAIPFQQIARTVKKYSEEITEEEKSTIDEVLDYDGIIEMYDPSSVDQVKNLYKDGNGSLQKLLSLWFKGMFKHPLTYLDATIANSYQYFYPESVQLNFSRDTYLGYDWVRAINEFGKEGTYSGAGSEGTKFLKANYILAQYVYLLEYCPVICMVSNSGILFLLNLYLFLYSLSSIKEKKKELLLLIPSIIGMFLCIAGPTFVNHGNRYALPAAWPAFVLSGICLRNEFSRKSQAVDDMKIVE